MDSKPHPSLFSSYNYNTNIKEHPPRKPPTPDAAGGGGGNGDRSKRDEWSEGAVSCLLEAYESKWTLRNRAKLKGHDWEDVAKFVSARANSTKSPKTLTQCKNKIESMKKRYRSESATGDDSSWPLYHRLDHLLRGNAPASPQAVPRPVIVSSLPLMLVEPPLQLQPQVQTSPLPPPPPAPLPPLPVGCTAQNSNGSAGVDRVGKEDEGDTKLSDHLSDKTKHVMDTDSSTPAALHSDDQKNKSKKTMRRLIEKKKRQRHDDGVVNIAESIRWLADAVVRTEERRIDTMKELERIRAEADAKRGEIELKRTEIIANTHLEIAKLFAGVGKVVDSSLRMGRN